MSSPRYLTAVPPLAAPPRIDLDTSADDRALIVARDLASTASRLGTTAPIAFILLEYARLVDRSLRDAQLGRYVKSLEGQLELRALYDLVPTHLRWK